MSSPLSPSLCIFCDNELFPKTAPEHVLLDSFGGRMTTQRAICSVCNNLFGGTIDKTFAEQAAHIRNMFQMPSGSGNSPPKIRNVATIDGDNIDLLSDGTPQQRLKPFRVAHNDDGSSTVEITLRSMDEISRLVPHIAARLDTSVDKVWASVEAAEASLITKPAGVLHFPLSFGGTDPMRSIVKSCLVLLATKLGPEALKGEAFDLARTFVLNGGDAFNLARCAIDGRSLPKDVADELCAEFGRMFNLIVVRSDKSGRAVGYFVLYNLFSWETCLAESGCPPNIFAALAANPLAPHTWSTDPAAAQKLDFDWLAAANDQELLDESRRRISVAMEHYIPAARERETGRIIDEVLSRHAVDGFIPDDDDAKFRFVGELSDRIARYLLGVPWEERIEVRRSEE